ncbi:protein MARD1-like [Momordica charantia]|uniref:Protein MARD1-like n=1 Tax=Momordica charantia TaxID=3673 RepID=A0A6J1DAD0_MOMCH|nr:protein MARD1-like [Momordica charantia]
MLRNRSRAVTGKQALMADHTSQSSSSSNSYTKPVPNPLFGSPRFRALAAMGFSETPQIDHSLISPTSVLDSNPFFSLQNPFSHDKSKLPPPPNSPKSIFSGNKQKISEPIGLALIEEKNDSKPSKSVIFSAKLRVQIPPPAPEAAVRGGCAEKTEEFCWNFGGLMTVKEMEVCEEYTCVRTHGANAKITHIFDNCVVNTKSFVDSGSQKSMAVAKNKNAFLSFCYTCKNHLQQTNDIYIYRGEKAFCSNECRYQEMLLDEEEDSS